MTYITFNIILIISEGGPVGQFTKTDIKWTITHFDTDQIGSYLLPNDEHELNINS